MRAASLVSSLMSHLPNECLSFSILNKNSSLQSFIKRPVRALRLSAADTRVLQVEKRQPHKHKLQQKQTTHG